MRDSGLAHLLAISGLHLGLVAATVIFFLRFCFAALPPLALRLPTKKIAALLGMLAAFGYLFLAGTTVPALRAFIMVAIAFFAVLIERNPFSLRLVAVAALAILVLAPESLLSPSFQLSFAAVTALVAFFRAKPFEAGERKREEGLGALPRSLRYFLLLGVTSAIAIAATTPFALHHFGRFAPYGLVANLVAVPLVGSLVMPSALLAALLWPFGLEGVGITLMVWLIDLLLLLAEEVAALPGARMVLPTLPLWGLLSCLAGGLFVFLMKGRPRWLGAPLLIAGLAALYLKPQPVILVDETSGLLSVRGEEGGYYFNSLRREGFTRKIWLEHLGETKACPGGCSRRSPGSAATARPAFTAWGKGPSPSASPRRQRRRTARASIW
jgi:competence protein ComEC